MKIRIDKNDTHKVVIVFLTAFCLSLMLLLPAVCYMLRDKGYNQRLVMFENKFSEYNIDVSTVASMPNDMGKTLQFDILPKRKINNSIPILTCKSIVESYTKDVLLCNNYYEEMKTVYKDNSGNSFDTSFTKNEILCK